MLQQLARSINDIHHENAYIETTFFDKLYGMEQDRAHLCEIHGACQAPTGVEAPKAFNGRDGNISHSRNDQTIIHISCKPTRLEMNAIEALGAMINEERP